MAEEVPLDRESIKLLASDTRVDILKALGKRRMTVSELASSLSLGKSTVFEHVTKLVEGGLVTRLEDPAREWVYYELSPRAKRLLSPGTSKIVLLFSTLAAVALLAVTAYLLAQYATPDTPDGKSATRADLAAAAPSERVFLAGAVGNLTVTAPGVPGPAFYLLTPSQVDEFRTTQQLPAGANGLQASALGGGSYRLRVPPLPGGAYALHVRGSDGKDNRDAMPVFTAATPVPALAGDVFVLGADDPSRIPLTLGASALDTFGQLTSFAHAGSAPDNAWSGGTPAPSDLYYRSPPSGSVQFKVMYDVPGTGGRGYAAGNVTTQPPRAATVPATLFAGEAANLTVTLYHPYRGVIGGANVTAWAGSTALGSALTNATGQADFALATVPAGATSVTLKLGNVTVGDVPVVRGLRFELLWGMEPFQNATLQVLDRLSGDPVQGASVVLSTGYTLTETDPQGLTTVQGHPPGTYVFRVSRAGYALHERIVVVGEPTEGAAAPSYNSTLLVDLHPRVVVATVGLQNPTNGTLHLSRSLAVDGVPVTGVNVTLAPGETRELTLVAPVSEGVHTLTVPGTDIPARTLRVEGLPDSTGAAPVKDSARNELSAGNGMSESRKVPVPGLVAALAVLALAAALLRDARRRA